MSFDIGKVFEGMLAASGDVLSAEWPGVQACVKAAYRDELAALEAIATARLDGEIDDAEMESQLADEKEALKVALLACKVKGKLAAQKAANAAVEVLADAVGAALKLV